MQTEAQTNADEQGQAPPDKLSAIELQWQRFQMAKAKNPLFAKYVATWNLRAEASIKARNLRAQVHSLSEELIDLKARLSPEERELL